jgi:tetratricopeptide (TPR) repeat protein
VEPERWRQIERLHHMALERERSLRGAFLAEVCGDDQELRGELESLLAEDEESFLETPALEVAAKALAAAPAALPAHIGRYRIIRLLGEGGMGAVYEAEQDEPRRIVAIKVIRAGVAVGESLWRFKHEAQALGRLQHPGIAQVYEAGTADNGFGPQPYFAMELIRGLPLGRYAETNGLDVRQRLGLMAKVCAAVHHAHQRGLIHRDLKPSNILVDETGQPKILDFGVARVMESDAQPTLQTGAGEIVGTLAYMSPEQVQGDPLEVDIRSDVYSLGVMLYELLAGRLPYDVHLAQLLQAAQTIREQDPPTLGSIHGQLRGDVETIAGKALDKDKARRYASAADLEADIERYLNDEPIAARPPSAGYQLRKFARRHRVLVLAGAAVVAALMAGVAASTWEAVRANREGQQALLARDRAGAAERVANRERDHALESERAAMSDRNRAVAAETQALEQRNLAVAEKRRADEESATAKAVVEFLQKDLLAQAGPSTQASPDLRVRTALDRAAAAISHKFEKQPVVEASIRETIGKTYQDLGIYGEAQAQLERALELRRHALGEEHPDTLASMTELAVLYQAEGKYAQAEDLFTHSLAMERKVMGATHPATLASMGDLAGLYRSEGKYAQANFLQSQTLEADRRVLGEEHRNTLNSMKNLAAGYRGEGKYGEAEQLFKRVLEIEQRVLGAEHPAAILSMHDLAAVYRDEGKYAEAERIFTKVLETDLRIIGSRHPNTTSAKAALGEVRVLQQKYVLAEPVLREALGDQESSGPNAWQRYWVQALLGASLAGQRRYGEAETLLESGCQGLLRMRVYITGEDRRVFKAAREWIVQFYEGTGKRGKAAEWRERLLLAGY